MRLRITRQPEGCIDGIHLDKLIVDFVYDVGTTLGCYLLAQGVAEPVDEDVPTHVPPWAETRFALLKSTPEPATAAAPVAPMAPAVPFATGVPPATAAPVASSAPISPAAPTVAINELSQAADRPRRRRKRS